jgi:acetyltransferase-like isoleucine patch superfamily enzyme
MRVAQRILSPAFSYLEGIFTGIYAIIQAVLGLIRDILKAIYLFFLQVFTRLFYIEREFPSSISLSARLDVIPRSSHLKRYRLFVARKSLIETSCVVCTWHGDVILKEGASIGIGSIVIGPVKIGENSICSQNCFIGGQSHIFQDISMNFLSQDLEIKQVVIGTNVWIGSNAVILLGVKIGDNSVIGAGSTVVEDIPSYCVAVGNPARVVKRYNFETKQWERV